MGACRLCMASGSIVSPDKRVWLSPLEAFSQGIYQVTWKECPHCLGSGVTEKDESEQIQSAIKGIDSNLRK